MLSINECREYFKNTKLTDEEIEKLRNSLYTLINQILDNILNQEVCKKQ